MWWGGCGRRCRVPDRHGRSSRRPAMTAAGSATLRESGGRGRDDGAGIGGRTRARCPQADPCAVGRWEAGRALPLMSAWRSAAQFPLRPPARVSESRGAGLGRGGAACRRPRRGGGRVRLPAHHRGLGECGRGPPVDAEPRWLWRRPLRSRPRRRRRQQPPTGGSAPSRGADSHSRGGWRIHPSPPLPPPSGGTPPGALAASPPPRPQVAPSVSVPAQRWASGPSRCCVPARTCRLPLCCGRGGAGGVGASPTRLSWGAHGCARPGPLRRVGPCRPPGGAACSPPRSGRVRSGVGATVGQPWQATEAGRGCKTGPFRGRSGELSTARSDGRPGAPPLRPRPNPKGASTIGAPLPTNAAPNPLPLPPPRRSPVTPCAARPSPPRSCH